MKRVLADVQSGRFAREWMAENATGGKAFTRMREQAAAHPIEKIGAKLRAMMPWLTKRKT
jgi:ketol-acid reductoisomerase